MQVLYVSKNMSLCQKGVTTRIDIDVQTFHVVRTGSLANV
jgi:hypothetical protein